MDPAEILFYGIPLLVVVFFATVLIRYLTARRQNRRAPGSVPEAVLKQRQIWLVVGGVALVILLAVVIAFTALLMMAVAYM